MARQIQEGDRVMFTFNPDGTYDLVVNGRTREFDIDPEDFRSTMKKYRAPLPMHVKIEDSTGYPVRTRISR